MPIHDWSKVEDGIFHDFHGTWIQTIKRALNDGILPPEYYALSEQVAVGVAPDVLTLEAVDGAENSRGSGGSVLTARPKTRFVSELGLRVRRRRNRVAVRHSSDDRVVAIIEVVSPGNKSSRHAVQAFVGKVVDLLVSRVHVLVIDLHPPTRNDPRGVHSLVAEEITGEPFDPPADKPLTLAAYEATRPPVAYVEPVAVGDELPEMPLFLMPGGHVRVPLEPTYLAAWDGIPLRWRRVIEAGD